MRRDDTTDVDGMSQNEIEVIKRIDQLEAKKCTRWVRIDNISIENDRTLADVRRAIESLKQSRHIKERVEETHDTVKLTQKGKSVAEQAHTQE